MLEDVSLSVAAGELVDVRGPSGCGKSTLLRALCRLLPRAGGELLLRGRPDSQVDGAAWRTQVCLAPQRVSLVSGSVRDNLLLPWTLRARRDAAPPADEELLGLLGRLGLGGVELARDASQLSGGQQARVALARVLATRPAVLVLDEVDAALDEESAERVRACVRSLVDEGLACVQVSHHVGDGAADAVVSLRAGRVTWIERREAR